MKMLRFNFSETGERRLLGRGAERGLCVCTEGIYLFYLSANSVLLRD